MSRLAFAIIPALLLGSVHLPSPAPLSLVSRLHVVSIHVRDAAAFDAVYFFLRDVLQLPLVYGEPSGSRARKGRLYAGFSVGNAYIEPCGPYESDPPFLEGQPARFHGLTFFSGMALRDAARELDARKILHSPFVGGGRGPAFIYVEDPLLTGPALAVSLWEVPDKNDPVNVRLLRHSLEGARGGLLGVRRMAEVSVEYPDEPAVRAQWRTLLAPAAPDGDRWPLGDGPSIRTVPGQDLRLQSIVLEVESLEKARRALSERHLMGSVTPGGDRVGQASPPVMLDTAKVWGLRIELREPARR